MLKRKEHAGEWVWWGGLALLAVPLLGFSSIPTLDGPAHVQTAAVAGGLWGGGGGIWGEVFELELRPWPNWAVQALLMGLGPLLGWPGAEKALLLGSFLALPLAFRYLLVRLGCASPWAGMLIFPLAHHHLLYLGFWNYTLGVALALAGAGWLVRAPIKGWKPVGVAALGLGLYFCHPLAWGLGGLLATGAWWCRGRSGGWRRWAAAWAPSGLLVGWYLATAPQGAPLEWMLPAELLAHGLRMDVAEPFRRSAPVAALAAGVLALAAAVAAWRHCPGGEARRGALELALAAAGAAGLCLVLPDTGGGGSLVQYRLTLVPWVLVLAAAGCLLGGASSPVLCRGAAAACLVAAGVGWSSLVAVFSSHQHPAAEVAALLERLPEEAVLEVRFSEGFRESGRWRIYVWEHAAARAAVDGGRMAWPGAYQFTAPGFPVRLRTGAAPSPDAVLDWGGSWRPPGGFEKAGEVEDPRAVLWLRRESGS